MLKSYSRSGTAIFLFIILFGIAVVVTRNVLTGPYPGHNDFMSRWEGARSYFVDGLNPYGAQASLNIQQKIYGGPARPDQDPGYFAYPFYTAFLVWPLVYTGYDWASAVWMVGLAACLIMSLFMLFDLFKWKPVPWLMGFLCLWVLLFYYSARGLILGQPGVIVYFLEVVAIWGLVKERHSLAGIALAISTLKPQMGFLFVPFLLLWAVRVRKWRFVTAFVVSMIILLVASFVLLPSWLGDWIAQLRLYPSYTALGSPVWIVTSFYLGLGGWAEASGSAFLGLIMLAAWYMVKDHKERFVWAAVITLTITHLIAPRTATPHFVVFLVPIIFYFAAVYRHYRGWGNLWIVLCAALLLILPWVHFLLTVEKQFEHPSVYLPVPFILLVLLVWKRQLWWSQSFIPRVN